MSKERKCGICGGTGHNARSCPLRYSNEAKDKIVWYKMTDLSDKQADDMTNGIAKLKRKVAPDAQVTYVKADKKSLPERIRKALGLGSGKDDD